MKLAILHFHFNRGGVTQVVWNQLRALDAVAAGGNRLPVALLFGGRRDGLSDEQLAELRSLDVSTHVLDALEYDEGTAPEEESLAEQIGATLREQGFTAAETVIHVHNHNLGKNVSLPGAIGRLAQNGFGFLLQIHDFAEDMRPANYRRLAEALAEGSNPAAQLYPQAPRIHYAALNGRDFGVLQRAGMAPARLHLQPNAVGGFGAMPTKESARALLHQRFGVEPSKGYVVYPVRGIRRKNVGEMLLWAAAGEGATVYSLTLAPLNPIEQVSYARWTEVARRLDLPCLFETGAPEGMPFEANLAAADALLTTSIAEGFGMVFLESWLAGRNLLGRNLPDITADFVESGIQFPCLYPALQIPVAWVGQDALRASLGEALRMVLEDYGAIATVKQETERIESLIQSECVDFAMLSSALQEKVVTRAHSDPTARAELAERNPVLKQAIAPAGDDAVVRRNADAVIAHYSLEACGKRLLSLYDQVRQSETESELETLPFPERILSTFLDASRLHPVRFEE